jgi:hypothetical protein
VRAGARVEIIALNFDQSAAKAHIVPVAIGLSLSDSSPRQSPGSTNPITESTQHLQGLLTVEPALRGPNADATCFGSTPASVGWRRTPYHWLKQREQGEEM